MPLCALRVDWRASLVAPAQEIAFLSKVAAPALVYGSQAEYNTEVLPGIGSASLWPSPPSVYAQLGSATKELFVDDQNGVSCAEAHSWLFRGSIRTFALGEPLHAVCSFLRRHVAQSGEAPPGRPTTAKEWALQAGRPAPLHLMPPRAETTRSWGSSWGPSWRLSTGKKPGSLLVGVEVSAARSTGPEEAEVSEMI